MKTSIRWCLSLLISLAGASLGGCDLGLDQLWKEPRELLIDRVEAARDAQAKTVEEVLTTMEKFKQVTGFDGGDLSRNFDILQTSFQRSEVAVKEVSSRIGQVERAVDGLLKEWTDELEQYHDEALRARSARELKTTRAQAEELIAVMRQAEAKTKPVLDVFRDQVLFMKHNLNMQAITSLEQSRADIETDVDQLIREMKVSIAQANHFIDTMNLNKHD